MIMAGQGSVCSRHTYEQLLATVPTTPPLARFETILEEFPQAMSSRHLKNQTDLAKQAILAVDYQTLLKHFNGVRLKSQKKSPQLNRLVKTLALTEFSQSKGACLLETDLQLICRGIMCTTVDPELILELVFILSTKLKNKTGYLARYFLLPVQLLEDSLRQSPYNHLVVKFRALAQKTEQPFSTMELDLAKLEEQDQIKLMLVTAFSKPLSNKTELERLSLAAYLLEDLKPSGFTIIPPRYSASLQKYFREVKAKKEMELSLYINCFAYNGRQHNMMDFLDVLSEIHVGLVVALQSKRECSYSVPSSTRFFTDMEYILSSLSYQYFAGEKLDNLFLSRERLLASFKTQVWLVGSNFIQYTDETVVPVCDELLLQEFLHFLESVQQFNLEQTVTLREVRGRSVVEVVLSDQQKAELAIAVLERLSQYEHLELNLCAFIENFFLKRVNFPKQREVLRFLLQNMLGLVVESRQDESLFESEHKLMALNALYPQLCFNYGEMRKLGLLLDYIGLQQSLVQSAIPKQHFLLHARKYSQPLWQALSSAYDSKHQRLLSIQAQGDSRFAEMSFNQSLDKLMIRVSLLPDKPSSEDLNLVCQELRNFLTEYNVARSRQSQIMIPRLKKLTDSVRDCPGLAKLLHCFLFTTQPRLAEKLVELIDPYLAEGEFTKLLKSGNRLQIQNRLKEVTALLKQLLEDQKLQENKQGKLLPTDQQPQEIKQELPITMNQQPSQLKEEGGPEDEFWADLIQSQRLRQYFVLFVDLADLYFSGAKQLVEDQIIRIWLEEFQPSACLVLSRAFSLQRSRGSPCLAQLAGLQRSKRVRRDEERESGPALSLSSNQRHALLLGLLSDSDVARQVAVRAVGDDSFFNAMLQLAEQFIGLRQSQHSITQLDSDSHDFRHFFLTNTCTVLFGHHVTPPLKQKQKASVLRLLYFFMAYQQSRLVNHKLASAAFEQVPAENIAQLILQFVDLQHLQIGPLVDYDYKGYLKLFVQLVVKNAEISKIMKVARFLSRFTEYSGDEVNALFESDNFAAVTQLLSEEGGQQVADCLITLCEASSLTYQQKLQVVSKLFQFKVDWLVNRAFVNLFVTLAADERYFKFVRLNYYNLSKDKRLKMVSLVSEDRKQGVIRLVEGLEYEMLLVYQGDRRPAGSYSREQPGSLTTYFVAVQAALPKVRLRRKGAFQHVALLANLAANSLYMGRPLLLGFSVQELQFLLGLQTEAPCDYCLQLRDRLLELISSTLLNLFTPEQLFSWFNGPQ